MFEPEDSIQRPYAFVYRAIHLGESRPFDQHGQIATAARCLSGHDAIRMEQGLTKSIHMRRIDIDQHPGMALIGGKLDRLSTVGENLAERDWNIPYVRSQVLKKMFGVTIDLNHEIDLSIDRLPRGHARKATQVSGGGDKLLVIGNGRKEKKLFTHQPALHLSVTAGLSEISDREGLGNLSQINPKKTGPVRPLFYRRLG
jgi:hypothetical protein